MTSQPAQIFTLVLDRNPTAKELDALYDAGLDDASPEYGPKGSLLHVSRHSATLTDAVLSAVRDTETTGLRVVALNAEDLVSLKTVAQRAGRTYEWARKLAHGAAPDVGAAGFPRPISGDGWSLYSWVEVSSWLAANRDRPDLITPYDRDLAALGHLIRARAISSGTPVWDAMLDYFSAAR